MPLSFVSGLYRDILKKTRESLNRNIDKNDPKFINLREELERLFKTIDTDGSMLLSRSEFKEFLGELHISFSNKRWKQIFRYVYYYVVCINLNIYI